MNRFSIGNVVSFSSIFRNRSVSDSLDQLDVPMNPEFISDLRDVRLRRIVEAERLAVVAEHLNLFLKQKYFKIVTQFSAINSLFKNKSEQKKIIENLKLPL